MSLAGPNLTSVMKGSAARQRYGHGTDPVDVVQRRERTGRSDRDTAPAGLIANDMRHGRETRAATTLRFLPPRAPVATSTGRGANIEVDQCPTQQFCRVMFFAESVAGEGQASVCRKALKSDALIPQ
jgi:hypothetical protein